MRSVSEGRGPGIWCSIVLVVLSLRECWMCLWDMLIVRGLGSETR
jgi:hypothetical protein